MSSENPAASSPASINPPEIVPVPSGRAHRALALDALRGLVIVLMALDHTRDFFSNAAFSPTNLEKTTAALFLTRWITHFCAPVFVFLAGMGIFLGGMKQTRAQHSQYLLIRGLWLILLEFTLVHWGWSFSFDFSRLVGQVIWAIGCSMMVMGLLIRLPSWAVALIGVVIVAGHNFLDPWTRIPEYRALLAPLHLRLGVWAEWKWGSNDCIVFVPYPFIPWLGIMALGYGCGDLFHRTREQGRSIFLKLGLACLALFLVLRGLNGYGDFQPRVSDESLTKTILSFLNCTKYPPSLDYVLMTLGPALILIWALDGRNGPILRFFATFGRVPLLIYLVHVPVIHLASLAVAQYRHGGFDFLLAHPISGREAFPETFGFGLLGVYLAWALMIALLYPLALLFDWGKKKGTSPLWRLF